MMNIDIERLIDAVAACNEAYNESTLELRRWEKVLDHVKIIARLLFSLFSPLLIQNMPITGARDAERTLKQRKIRTH